MANTVYFIRHGETFFNKYHRMQGWSDTPLTEKGWADAAQAGRALADLDFDYLFSSDLKRTVDTANTILKNHPTKKIQAPIQEPAFREEFFGYFEGADDDQSAIMVGAPEKFVNFREIIAKYGLAKMQNMIADSDPFHDAENHQQFWTRVDKGFDRLHALPDGSVSVVVSHGMTISAIVDRFGDGDYSEGPLNGSITKLTLTNDSTTVDFYNQLQIPNK